NEAEENHDGKKGNFVESGIAGLFRRKRNETLKTTNWDWEIDSIGLRVALRRITSRYGLPILITENGLGEFDKIEENEFINDDYALYERFLHRFGYFYSVCGLII